LDEAIGTLKTAGGQLADALGADGPNLRGKFAHYMTYNGTVGAVKLIVRTLNDNRPSAPSDKPPGFLPARVVKMRESAAKK
jgi:hypothetical protein